MLLFGPDVVSLNMVGCYNQYVSAVGGYFMRARVAPGCATCRDVQARPTSILREAPSECYLGQAAANNVNRVSNGDDAIVVIGLTVAMVLVAY